MKSKGSNPAWKALTFCFYCSNIISKTRTLYISCSSTIYQCVSFFSFSTSFFIIIFSLSSQHSNYLLLLISFSSVPLFPTNTSQQVNHSFVFDQKTPTYFVCLIQNWFILIKKTYFEQKEPRLIKFLSHSQINHYKNTPWENSTESDMHKKCISDSVSVSERKWHCNVNGREVIMAQIVVPQWCSPMEFGWHNCTKCFYSASEMY